MKTYKLQIITLIIGLFTFISCTTMSYTTLDVLRPAKIAFASNVQHILLVNNTVVQPSDYGHKTQLIDEKASNVILPTDSLSLFCLASLKEQLDSKNFFASVQMIQNSKNKSKNFRFISQLNEDSIKNLCNSEQVDAILSLDRIRVDDDIIQYFNPEMNSIASVLEARYETNWSLHYPGKSDYVSMLFKDTVYWESDGYSKSQSFNSLPKRTDALVDGALNVGQKSINRFIPYWEKVDRYFFESRNKLMKRGMDSLYVKNWTSAIQYWDMAIQKTHSKATKAKAANNIAIAYEIIGDIDKALEYATQSYYTFGSATFGDYTVIGRLEDYINDLTQRKNEITALKKQVGE